MRKISLMATAVTAFILTGYENKETAPNDDQADTTIATNASVDATADSLTPELDMQLPRNNTDIIQVSLTSLQSKYAELVASGKLDTAKTHAVKIQLFLNDDIEEIKATTASNVTIAMLVSGIQNLPTTAEATTKQAEAAVKNNAEEMMKEAGFETNKATDKAKRRATKATDNANARTNEAKDKADEALDKNAREANEKIDQAREQIRKGLGL